jgi:hypothetical protein
MKSSLFASVVALVSLAAKALPIEERARTPPTDTSVELTQKLTGLNKRELYDDVSNELGDCRPVTVIFARGTIEPGNVGLLAGPPFFDVLSSMIGNALGVQGVPYG